MHWNAATWAVAIRNYRDRRVVWHARHIFLSFTNRIYRHTIDRNASLRFTISQPQCGCLASWMALVIKYTQRSLNFFGKLSVFEFRNIILFEDSI